MTRLLSRHSGFLSTTVVLLGAAVMAITFDATPVRAKANGDLLRTIIADRSGTVCVTTSGEANHPSVGVGIAFDGTNLLISCYGDNTVTAINPADGSQVAVHNITGAGSLGALAWDNGRGLLWGCSNFNDVGTIDLTTNVFTPTFTSAGCFDGLAYDASDDTIWASADAAPTAEHYDIVGTQLTSTAVSLGSCGNSGIAVGGTLLYLANNGCSQIYTANKDFTGTTLFATATARLEDMECDNITFAGTGVGAMWSIDAYDNYLQAWEIPLDSCKFGGGGETALQWMTGGGSVLAAATSGGKKNDDRVTHGFQLNCDASKGGNLQVNWGKGEHFHLTELTSAQCSDNPAFEPPPPGADFDTLVGTGNGSYNNQPGATISFTFTDAGEPGKNDTVQMTIKDASNVVVLTTSGKLQNGNHQAHQN